MPVKIKVRPQVKESRPDITEAINKMESIPFTNWRKAYDYIVTNFGSTFSDYCEIR